MEESFDGFDVNILKQFSTIENVKSEQDSASGIPITYNLDDLKAIINKDRLFSEENKTSVLDPEVFLKDLKKIKEDLNSIKTQIDIKKSQQKASDFRLERLEKELSKSVEKSEKLKKKLSNLELKEFELSNSVEFYSNYFQNLPEPGTRDLAEKVKILQSRFKEKICLKSLQQTNSEDKLILTVKSSKFKSNKIY